MRGSSLGKILAVARREFFGQWRSPRAYVLLAFYLFIQGFLFSLHVLDQGPGAFRLLCRDLAVLWLLVGPAVASGALAGERSSGELDLLLDAPISELELAAGKLAGSFGLIAPLVLASLLPAGVALYLGAEVLPVLVAMLGVGLLAFVTTAAGLVASSFAAHAASATVLGVVLLLILVGSGIEASRVGGWVGALGGPSGPGAMNPFWLLDGLFMGYLDSRPLLLFPAFACLCLFLIAGFLRAERWPRHRTGRRLWSFLATSIGPLVSFVLLHQLVLRFPRVRDLSRRTEVSAPLVHAIRELPSPLLLHRARPKGAPSHDPLDDLLSVIQREVGEGLRVRDLVSVDYLNRLRSKGLLAPPRDGLVLEVGERVVHVPLENLQPLPENENVSQVLLRSLHQLTAFDVNPDLLLAVGHGESPEVLPTLTRVLGAQGFRTEPVRLVTFTEGSELPEIPLLLVGPRIPLAPQELEILRQHLERGGRLLACFDPEVPRIARSILPMLDTTSVGGWVADPSNHLAGAGPGVLLAEPYEHPSTRSLGRATIVVPTALAIRPLLPGNPGYEPVLVASRRAKHAPSAAHLGDPSTWTFAGATGGPPHGTGQLRQVIGLAREGPLAAAPYRAILMGDSDLFSQEILTAFSANALFLRGIVTWLTEKPEELDRHPQRVRTVLTDEEHIMLLHGLASLPAFLALSAGFLAWLGYRRRFLPDAPSKRSTCERADR